MSYPGYSNPYNNPPAQPMQQPPSYMSQPAHNNQQQQYQQQQSQSNDTHTLTSALKSIARSLYKPAPPATRPVPNAPPAADQIKWRQFNSIQHAIPGKINSVELQTILNQIEGKYTYFPEHIARALIKLFVKKPEMTEIDFEDYTAVIEYLDQWKVQFDKYDGDRDGYVTSDELRSALINFGFNLPEQTMNRVIQRYSAKAGTARHVAFDEFILCCITTKRNDEEFRKRDPNRTGYIQLSYDQFFELTLKGT